MIGSVDAVAVVDKGVVGVVLDAPPAVTMMVNTTQIIPRWSWTIRRQFKVIFAAYKLECPQNIIQ